MIVKHVAMKTVQKSDFAGLVQYITGTQAKNERVGNVTLTNCEADRLDVATYEVLGVQGRNTRSAADKTYHLIVSFRPNEQPDAGTLKAIEARICDGLGFGEHQRISAVHHDTDNLHIHIAINKIHPTRYTILEPFNAFHTLGQLCAKLEREYGLEPDNHHGQKMVSENRSQDLERHAGVESLMGWIKQECAPAMQEATSWEALHQVMQDHGLELRERGNGLVIQTADGLAVKASSIGREFSKTKLEGRFGSFEPSPEHIARSEQLPRKQYEKNPIRSRVNTVELHARYKADQLNISGSRTSEWAAARVKKDRLIEIAKLNGRAKRSAIKLLSGAGLGKKILYSATSSTLKSEIEKINKQYLRDRQEIYEKYKHRAWADWLRANATEGDQEAMQALRARDAAQGLRGNTLTGTGQFRSQETPSGHDSVTKKGTIIYRVGPTAVRDDGDRLKVSRDADQECLHAALRMAMNRYGNRISVSGTADFKEQMARVAAGSKFPIVFDDVALERRRLDLLATPTTKEKKHEQSDAALARGRTIGSSIGGSGSTTAPGHGGALAGQPGAAVVAIKRAGKPNVGRVGRSPPPASRNRLRSLSQLGMIQFSQGSEVLLPRNVYRHLEQHDSNPIHELRRNIFRDGLVGTDSFIAADKYIAEREEERLRGFVIPKHVRYSGSNAGEATFAGVRLIDGESLGLLRQGDQIMVLPVDEPTAQKLKSLVVGDALAVTGEGIMKTKRGRSR